MRNRDRNAGTCSASERVLSGGQVPKSIPLSQPDDDGADESPKSNASGAPSVKEAPDSAVQRPVHEAWVFLVLCTSSTRPKGLCDLVTGSRHAAASRRPLHKAVVQQQAQRVAEEPETRGSEELSVSSQISESSKLNDAISEQNSDRWAEPLPWHIK